MDSSPAVMDFRFYEELDSYPRSTGVLMISAYTGSEILPGAPPLSILTLRCQAGMSMKTFRGVAYNRGCPNWNGDCVNIPVTVFPKPANPMNKVIISLFLQSQFPGEEDDLIGLINLDLHAIISKKYQEKAELVKGREYVGKISLKCEFFYGMFGFGYSMQLRDEVAHAQVHVQKTRYYVIQYNEKAEERTARAERLEKLNKVCEQSKWFKGAEMVVDGLAEQQVCTRLARLRQICAGQYETKEIPSNHKAVSLSVMDNPYDDMDVFVPKMTTRESAGTDLPEAT